MARQATREKSRRSKVKSDAAAVVRLTYVSDAVPGITRKRIRGHFAYFSPDGSRIVDPEEIKRINKLVIPPAYTDVWICPDPSGHIQATGRDARGRKQYRYHAAWREMRDSNKYNRMLAFCRALPTIRNQIEQDFSSPGVKRERILATILKLLETTLIRVGNEEYARTNQSYGLTTLMNEHVEIHGSSLSFRFRGKSGVEHDITVRDPRLARIVKRCVEIPGHELFQYLDETGERHKVGSGDVNDYLRSICQADFTAKDYRTWAGSVLALDLLCALPPEPDESARKKNVVSVVTSVAERLGNTPAVCRRCYIHPGILDAYINDQMPSLKNIKALQGLKADEARLFEFLEQLDVPRAPVIQLVEPGHMNC